MNFFNYESKPMQLLMMLGDLVILNLLYILCCLPIFTIGAAQAGLYTGLKTLLDPEDDTYCSSAFFKGFKNGFGKVTVAWGLLFIVEVVLALVLILCSHYAGEGYGTLPLWASIVALCIVALFQSLIPLFHARFNCTPIQLIRNAWFLAIAHPLRSLFVGLATWLPVVILGVDYMLFFTITPVFALIYYSLTFLFGFSFMKKPFNVLIDHFNDTHGDAASSEQAAQIPEECEDVEPEEE